MRKVSYLFPILVLLLMTAFVSPNKAEERATRKECIKKVSEVIKLIKEQGSEAAYKIMLDENGPFVWKDAHIFSIHTETGALLAHINGAVGFQMRYYSDATGGYPFADILDLLKSKDEGWLTYISDRMGRSTPRLKHMHYRKVPGEKIVLCSGYYPVISENQVSTE